MFVLLLTVNKKLLTKKSRQERDFSNYLRLAKST